MRISATCFLFTVLIMAEPVIYMRGIPESLIGQIPSLSDTFFADLKSFASLTDEQVEKLSSHLAQAKGFLSPKILKIAILEILKDDEVGASVHRAIRRINPESVENLITTLEQSKDEDDFPLDGEIVECLKLILPKLIQPYPALKRYQKAEHLTKATGQPLESIELICDIRPLFDENRERVEGMMPYTLLEIVATGRDGLPKSFEAILTCQQVHDLVEKTEKAKHKLEVLRDSIEKWEPECMPDIQMTRSPRKESKGV